ncbi:glycosyltransferase family 4 protein [Cellvibrio sp. UBA7661]|uniref:glycosyltransferase family 4 protein n=1 Tax=Cellvibrio sp. UBA7661 TaxID=1946311 RepID=UPI002F350DF8
MSISVTHVVRQYLPSIGGMEEVVRNIARHQLRSGHKATRIVTLDRLFRNTDERLPAQESIDGVEVIRLPYKGSSRYPLCPAILQHLGDSDVIHVHGVDFFYDFLAATKWLHKRPLVLSTHGGFFHTDFASRAKQAYFKTITRLSSNAYSKVVATSANDGHLFSQIMGERKLQVIENGVDIEKYANQAASVLQPSIVYFGRWSVNKGLLPALELFAALHRKNPQWRFAIAGREYDHNAEELLQHIEWLGLKDAVQLIANPSDDEIRRLIRQASYFLCLSRHEGFGIAPIEAMSAGLTPILSDIPPFRRLVEASRLGFLTPLDAAPTAAVNNLLSLHEEGESSYQLRRAEAMDFARRYAWPEVADRYLELYQQVRRRP